MRSQCSHNSMKEARHIIIADKRCNAHAKIYSYIYTKILTGEQNKVKCF